VTAAKHRRPATSWASTTLAVAPPGCDGHFVGAWPVFDPLHEGSLLTLAVVPFGILRGADLLQKTLGGPP
jgi:hypothetical protein